MWIFTVFAIVWFSECDAGFYGVNCSSSCSGNCEDGDPCNKVTGHCDSGCQPGYRNDKCDEG